MKYILSTIGFLAAIYASQWAFNHINAWVGIAAMAGTGIAIIYYLYNQIKKQMKNLNCAIIVLLSITMASCGTRVEPNYQGVLMENYGKNGKNDFTLQKGKVNDWGWGTRLYQVPLFEQRASFVGNAGETDAGILHLKAADNTEFTSKPSYSYVVIENRAVDVVFQNKQIDGDGDAFMRALENNILEANIYDILKDESRKYVTDTLMASGGSLKFEDAVRNKVAKAFLDKGLELKTFTAQLDFSDKVKSKIDTRNEVNTNVSVLDQQIIEQRKKNELVALQAEYNKILSTGITPQLLQQQFIEKWDGKTPLYGTMPVTLFKNTP